MCSVPSALLLSTFCEGTRVFRYIYSLKWESLLCVNIVMTGYVWSFI
jgi:hypothetical protein